MRAQDVAEVLWEFADRLRAAGETNSYRLAAYKRASGIIGRFNGNFRKLTARDLREQAGLGESLVEKILTLRDTGKHPELTELRMMTRIKPRLARHKAAKLIKPVVAALRRKFPHARVEVAGSFRRRKRFLKDVDILVATDKDVTAIVRLFRSFGKPLNKGASDQTITIRGFQVDLRIVPRASFGAGLLFFTGSANFNMRCRRLAKERGRLLNRYGLFERQGNQPGRLVASKAEHAILTRLGLGFIEPEDRA